MTGVYPYGRYVLNERVTLWGVVGYGGGTLTLAPGTQPAMETDIELAMAGLGLRGTMVEAPQTGGPELAATSDALWVRTTSAAVRSDTGNLAASEAVATRLRLGLEGTYRGLTLGDGALEPRIELGVRHDGGDAETGFGLDLGGGVAWRHAGSGVSAEVSGRGLMTHESKGFGNRGFSGALAWDPRPESARGPSLTLTQTMGAPADGGMDALLGRTTLAGLSADEDGGDDLRNRRLELRLGHGFPAFGGGFASVPEIGAGLSDGARDYSLGWRFVPARQDANALEFGVEARRRVSAAGAPEDAVGARITARW